MEYMGLNEVREAFLSFFEGKEHLRLASAPLVPRNDKSLLLINSGMAPLKPFFTGQETPPRKRVTTCQKCIRTGDIENVGKTARHGTFFEMLGNFSFGDYFKEEAVAWAWEFVTEVLKLPKDRLYPSIYEDDDEAFDIWHKQIGIPKERIFRFGKDDNFWEVGLGPCGPCSELYYDRGPEFGCGSPNCTVGCECDRYIEFWNLVFTQFDRQEDGSYPRLASPNIDTGMGLERIAAIMQGVESIFDVDTVKAVRDKVCELAGVTYQTDREKDVSIRVITDHVRSVTFMTADGVLPSNEGRGYVLRRLLRRALRHGRLLGINDKFITTVVQVVIDNSGGAYPELIQHKDYIFKVLSMEEARFYDTLETGMEMLRGYIEKIKAAHALLMGGKEAFKMYDTFGFPLELMKEILEESNIAVNEAEFFAEMENQRNRARAAREESNYMGADETVYDHLDASIQSEFAGYSVYEADARVLALVVSSGTGDSGILPMAIAGTQVAVILDRTPFYAASGGQAGDSGTITGGDGLVIEVSDCVKVTGGRIAHIGVVKEGAVKTGDTVTAAIDLRVRLSAARNHTATHLLQKALREVLGAHVEQAGSYVSAERLRFDFTHFAPLSPEELLRVEDIVNDRILDAIDVGTSEKSMDEARSLGATALFGEKYGQTVRVVDIGGYSIELCGGTHIQNTAQIGSFKILSESSAAAGVRRIEALTGRGALAYYRDEDTRLLSLAHTMKANPLEIMQKVKAFLDQNHELRQEVDRLKAKTLSAVIDGIMKNQEMIDGMAFVHAEIDGSPEDLRGIGDRIRDRLQSGVIFLSANAGDKVNLLAMATDDAVSRGVNAGQIIREAVDVLGGKGGGRANMAQAGGRDASRLADALGKAKEVLLGQLEK